MKNRRLLVAATTAVALLGSGLFVSAARADDPPQVAYVGGGAAGIVGHVVLSSYPISNLPGNTRSIYGVDLTESVPRVVMGPEGGNEYTQVLNRSALGVTAKVVSESIHGNRQGNPFAQASSSLVDVRGITGPLAGISFGAVNVSCLWNTAGSSGSTVLTDVNGTVNRPAVNEQHDLPSGLGWIRFNEQHTDSQALLDANGNYIPDPNNPPYGFLSSQTLYVIGAHIHLDVPLAVTEGGTVTDIELGFTSCDPVQPPPLSGIRLLQANQG